MDMPIVKGLEKYAKENNIRFHMPGHKGRNSLLEWGKLIPQIDVTEVDGTDNLHNPTSMILESQDLAAKTFGAKKTFYSINGTTGGIYAAITSVCKPGDRILIQRNCHKSVYNATILGRLEPVYVYPEYDEDNNIVLGINPLDIQNMLEKYNDIKAIVITSPSYYGICSNIKEIAKIVHRFGKILIVDEAHGSHLKFSKRLPESALEGGADIVIQSTHKTLPAFTQASMVHVGTDRIDTEKLKERMTLYQTTSPSYILMASIDMARAYIEKKGTSRLDLIINAIEENIFKLKDLDGVRIFDNNSIKSNNYSFDLTKVLISLKGINITGRRLEKILRQNYKIQLEMSDLYYGIALTSVLDEPKYIEKLTNAIADIYNKRDYRLDIIPTIDVKYIKTETVMPLYKAYYKEKKLLNLNKCNGKIAGDFIIPYPPGIPLVSPGERINSDIIEYIKVLKENNINILGIQDESKIKIIE
ncbi:aminotransferase class I/II-fold pyridoxal phosphate-dependent enzyme [Thermohalobacter berrensis]|uniref:Arginine / lysine / ornithine decarboxylase n=1 Tax=Thermohalobacter berrensis TaxID=99594 RepID=A0A419SUD7_9FIRM|nr:aminotransferase class I/II-fold pyridoxal phosphate-dependent enzyme [Thermohalobacter berrensis]RKD28825.1 arginine / lysine / ornithine decarboxylase [Thermohalobacter berrensis]